MRHTPPQLITDTAFPEGIAVLVRSSLNAPIDDGAVIDTFRLQESARTITYLQERGARVTVIGHLGREGQSFERVWECLETYTQNLSFIREVTGDGTRKARERLNPGEAVLLENVRIDPREVVGDKTFAHDLLFDAELFVFDDFSVAHRNHASITGLASLRTPYAGIRFHEEIAALGRFLQKDPTRTFVILGGAKSETKIPLLEILLEKYNTVFVGGVIANTILQARGVSVGTSVTERVTIADHILNNPRLVLAHDGVVRRNDGSCRVTSIDAIQKDESIIDVGPETVQKLQGHIQKAQTILWNGPLGLYENGGDAQSLALSTLVGERLQGKGGRSCFSLLGGGDTTALIRANKKEKDWSFLSTGGGALLHYVTHESFPLLDVS